ncbi:hypothetical protein Q5425_31410 [Amycolatopsis sp. A133]|uniref:hypothetical protein n=1 Tax=Amycolatopsis sp. A133 TaxID=3064472 RepID=UPI0027FF6976|nr:hypothetical protein [Amycolatopsis sp. A133]MDQ7808264.1 hypothetical protein [Amycolatopsis sp. A133]
MTTQRNGRRPRAARRAAERAEAKVARRAERAGRRVPPTIAGFEAALDERGYDGLAEALISWHNRRMERMIHVADMMQPVALPLLAGYLPLGLAAQDVGAQPGRAPCHSGVTWSDHLSWGLDSIAGAVRLMLSLQPIGASIIARTQLERWSANLAANTDGDPASGEDTVASLNRLWKTPGVRLASGTPPVGDLFAELSELLHGRGPLMPLVWLDVADISDPPTSEHVKLLDTIGHALVVSLSQLRTCLTAAATERGRDVMAKAVHAVRLVAPAESWLPDPQPFLWPLTPEFFTAFEGQLAATASAHRRTTSALHADKRPDAPPEVWPVLAFGSHRFRALTLASWAYEHEREIHGTQFDEHGIIDLTTEAVLAGEMAAMLAQWIRGNSAHHLAADAFAVCASALRSAEWLWLEDDDRAMGCLRCVIEQAARARTWRVKPDRAAKIEANPKAKPRDWIEGAGWRRLNLLNRGTWRVRARDGWHELEPCPRRTRSASARFGQRTG